MAWSTLLVAAPGLINAGVNVVRAVHKMRQDEGPSSTNRSRPSVRVGLPKLDQEQLGSMAVIAREVKRASLSPALSASRPALIMALWVNAWHESRLRPGATNDKGEASVGLFQINQRAHRGHVRRDLQRADYNTRVILDLIQRRAVRFGEILDQGASIATLTAAITLWIERPKHPEEKAVQRAQTVHEWFPELAELRARGFRA